LALVLLGWFLWPFVVRGADFPVGPDGPVYLWWMRLAGLEGLSAVGHRPGASALALVLSGTLGLSVVQATAALEVGLGVAVGMSGAALLRRRSSVAGAWLGGLLAGTFAVHLAAGYLANLAFVPSFLAAIASLDEDRRRATVLAAIALGAGGLAHPLFFLLGALVLLVAAAGAMRSGSAEARRLAGAAVGAGAIVGAGLLALIAGPRPPEVDTSKDGFLRRAGLGDELREAYRERLLLRWPRYVPWLSVPLAFVGAPGAEGVVGRILRSWLWVTIVGIVVAFATGWFPGDRFVTFGFAIPLLAALGLERVRARLRTHTVLAWAAVGGLTVVMLAGSAIAWNRQEPFLTEEEVRAVSEVNAIVSSSASRFPIAFTVDEAGATLGFTVPRAGNVIRAAMPPDRIRDVVVIVPPRRGTTDATHDALAIATAEDLAEAEHRIGTQARVFVLATFDTVGAPSLAFDISPRPEPVDPLEPAGAGSIAWASVATLVLLWVIGFGWARLGLSDPVTAAAAAPALGSAAVILVAVALDLVGVRVGTTFGAAAVSALAGGGGYLAWFVLERRARAGAPPQVQEQPAE
jgi:hypothetical protein